MAGNHSGREDVEVMTPEQVMEQELDHVALRRDAPVDTHLRQSLVGLALSGGGIRSATFGLGVLEGLKEHGLLERIDYLSTVSGGGYIGGWLSANCRRAAERDAALPATVKAVLDTEPPAARAQRELAKRRAHRPWLAKDANWTLAIDHLRRYSNYLSPVLGLFSADTWSMLTIWLRNTMLVQASVIAALAFVLLLPRLSMELFRVWPDANHWRWTTVVIFIIAAAGIAANLVQLSRDEKHAVQERYWKFWTPAAVLAIAGAAGLIYFQGLDLFAAGPVPWLSSFCVALLAVVAGYLLFPFFMWALNRVQAGAPFERVNYTQGWVQWGVVVPMIVTAFLIAAVLWGQASNSPFPTSASYGTYLRGQWRYWPFPLLVALVSLWLFAYGSLCPQKGNPLVDVAETGGARAPGWRRRVALILWIPLPALLTFYLAICVIGQLLSGWFEADAARGIWLALMWAPSLVLFAFSLSIVVLIGMLGGNSLESVREWWSRLGAWLSIYALVWLGVSLAAIVGPQLAAMLFSEQSWGKLTAAGGWVLTTAGGLLAASSASTGSDSDNAPKSTTDFLRAVLAAIGPIVFIAGLLVLVAALLHLMLVSGARTELLAVAAQNPAVPVSHWQQLNAQNLAQLGWMLAGAAALTWLLSRRVDINVFNLNTFYRNRLVRCYLGAARFLKNERRPQNFIGLDEFDDFPISELAVAGGAEAATAIPAGPLHIVNCALNLGGSSDLALHTRHSASFIITPYAVGSGYMGLDAAGNEFPVGYRRTSEYGGQAGYPTLGQAISVSGAAASPNMGYHTSATAAFLLTMFNARLGWWFPDPRRRLGHASPRHSLFYLAKELFGLADDHSAFLNVSDGGHFENLGAYELVRRKCQVIIISDAECDPGLRCEGLARLIRMCQVDFDARIDIDVSAIRRASGAPHSRDRCAVGRITYDASSDHQTYAKLIYVKASMTGFEDTAILQYKATHPAFPHEPTGNQFYGEDQFESYRNLGKDIARQVFERVIPESGTLPSWQAIGDELLAIWAPNLATSTQFTSHSRILMDLYQRLASDPQFKSLERLEQEQLAIDWPEGTLPEVYVPVYYLCMQIIQLMENVYLDLNFEKTWEHVDNQGWQATFRNWAALPAVRRTWSMSSARFGWRFRYFCKRNLGLPMAPVTVLPEAEHAEIPAGKYPDAHAEKYPEEDPDAKHALLAEEAGFPDEPGK